MPETGKTFQKYYIRDWKYLSGKYNIRDWKYHTVYHARD